MMYLILRLCKRKQILVDLRKSGFIAIMGSVKIFPFYILVSAAVAYEYQVTAVFVSRVIRIRPTL
jgi:hypothetical protein